LARQLHLIRKGVAMLKKKTPLEDDDVIEVLERELEQGVQIDRSPEIEEDSKQTVLGGLITAEEHVSVHPLKQE
jgi:hypothetical protein